MDLKNVKFILTATFITIVAALVIGSFTNNQLLIYIMLGFFAILQRYILSDGDVQNAKNILASLLCADVNIAVTHLMYNSKAKAGKIPVFLLFTAFVW